MNEDINTSMNKNLTILFSLIYILMLLVTLNISPVNNYSKANENIQNKNENTLVSSDDTKEPIKYSKNKEDNALTKTVCKVYDSRGKLAGYIDDNKKIKIIKTKGNKDIISYANTNKFSVSELLSSMTNINNDLFTIGEVNKNDIKSRKLKKIYLTFDDGPTQMTYKVLKVLKKNNIKATFFFNGAKDNDGKKVIKEIVKEGHLLALHTYSHDYKKVYKSPKAFLKDLEKNRINFLKATGYDCRIFRFPGGTNNTISFSYGGKKVIKKAIKLTKAHGYDYVDWNAFPDDVDAKMPKKQYNRIIKQAKWNDEVVVLMHVFDRNTALPKGLDHVIKTLKKQGYTFDTVDNLNRPVKFAPAK